MTSGGYNFYGFPENQFHYISCSKTALGQKTSTINGLGAEPPAKPPSFRPETLPISMAGTRTCTRVRVFQTEEVTT